MGSTRLKHNVGAIVLISILCIGCLGKKNYSLYQAVFRGDNTKAQELISKGFDPPPVSG